MVLPAVLFVVFFLAIFVYPGIVRGVDVSGGTLIIVRTDKHIDMGKLSNALSKFNLPELKLTSFSGGVQIQFGTVKPFEEASKLLYEAKALLPINSSQGLSLCRQAYSVLKPFTNAQVPADAKTCIKRGFETLASARESFNGALDDEISKLLGLTSKQKSQKIQHTEVSPALGNLFWKNAVVVLIVAAIAIFFVIFMFFREFVPSIAIILAAMFDILSALAALAVLRIPFSLATVSSLLMLVGYSVDTDIMLTTRVFKGMGHIREDARSALKTGLTMTGTTLAAVSVMVLFSFMWNITLMKTIAVVLLFGLLGDLISTWFMNAPLLLSYAEKKGRTRK